MKKNLLFYLFAAAIFPLLLSSCTVEDYGEVETYHFTVANNQWQWNSLYSRYEYTFDFSNMSKMVYENGSITGAVFINEQDSRGRWYETLKPLPFSQTYSSAQKPYTETISFDVSPGSPYYVTFYIQASDMQGAALLTYDFKITLAYVR